MKKTHKSLLIKFVWVSLLVFVGCISNETKVNAQNKDPNIFVHGLTGFGYGELGPKLHYWGGNTQDIIGDVTALGYNGMEAVVSPFGSNWDRACELYAYIKGGTVDYGAVHSAKYGHERYGRTFPGIYPTWGADNKVHLIGHSQGGQTSRLIETLLREGSAEERTYAEAKGDVLSDLFQGDKQWVTSVTAIATPHNGTQVASMARALVNNLIYTAAFMANSQSINLSYDFKLDQWGLRQKPGETSSAYLKRIMASKVWTSNEDIVLHEFTTTGAQKLNNETNLSSETYYSSFSGNASYTLTGRNYYPLRTVCATYALPAAYIGSTGPLDMRSNDGLVPVKSALSPSNQTSMTANNQLKKGIWNVEATIEGWEHMDFVGQDFIQAPKLKKQVHDFYITIVKRNQSL